MARKPLANKPLPRARTNKAPSGSILANPGTNISTTSFSPLSAITGDIFGSFMNDIAKSFGAGSVKDMWIRGGLIVLGGLLILAGVIVLITPAVMGTVQSPVGQAAVEAAAPELGVTTSALGSGRQQSRALARQRMRNQTSQAQSSSTRAAASQSRAATQAAREKRLSGSP